MRHEVFSELAALCSDQKTPIPCVLYVKFSDEETPRSFGYSKKEFSPPILVLLHHWFIEHRASSAQFEEHAHHYLRMLEVARLECPARCIDYSEGGTVDEFGQQDARAAHYDRWFDAQKKMADIYENIQNIDFLVMLCINPVTLREEIENNIASYQAAVQYENFLNNVPPSLRSAMDVVKRRYQEYDAEGGERDEDDDGPEGAAAASSSLSSDNEEEPREGQQQEEPMIIED